ncbi:MAG: hypothetical protein AB7K67_10440 [Hyphomicrobiaceae bacterium]
MRLPQPRRRLVAAIHPLSLTILIGAITAPQRARLRSADSNSACSLAELYARINLIKHSSTRISSPKVKRDNGRRHFAVNFARSFTLQHNRAQFTGLN